VLVEVPVMLMLVRVANNTYRWFTIKSSMSK
jgi:ACR3 family arsenite efflux pump ArsB